MSYTLEITFYDDLNTLSDICKELLITLPVEQVFDQLPINLKCLVAMYGSSDSVFRDEVYIYLIKLYGIPVKDTEEYKKILNTVSPPIMPYIAADDIDDGSVEWYLRSLT